MDQRRIQTAGTALMACYLQKAPLFRLTISGASMGRFLLPGDQIECRGISPTRIRCGDIIVYRKGGQLIVHRVVRKIQTNSGLSFLTRGDSQYLSDGVIGQDQILGKVVAVLKDGHQRIDFASSKAVLVNRLAGFYGRFLHHSTARARWINLASPSFLPFSTGFRSLSMLPFQFFAQLISR